MRRLTFDNFHPLSAASRAPVFFALTILGVPLALHPRLYAVVRFADFQLPIPCRLLSLSDHCSKILPPRLKVRSRDSALVVREAMLTAKGEKIMNITTSFIAIVSLLLALVTADIATKDQSNSTCNTTTVTNPNRIALNHNETMVSDEPLAEQSVGWSQLLMSLRGFFFSRPSPGGCDDWGCGMNHNEIMVSDAPLAQSANLWSNWLTRVQTFFSSRPSPGGCDEWGCGTNHNETMVRDASLAKNANLRNNWLTSIETFFVSRAIPGGCDEWGCGSNHNESLVRDTNR